MPSPKRNFILGSICLALALAVSIILSEIAIRVITDYRLVYNIEMVKYAKELKMPDPLGIVSHVHRPNSRSHLMGVDIELNSLGNRSPEIALTKDPNSRRILVLGSSLTLGWGVPSEQIFTSLLEKHLNAEKPLGRQVSFEVINSGVGNYNTYFQQQLFHRQYPLIKPDVVVLNYVLGNVEPQGMGRNNPILKHSFLAAYFFDRFTTLEFSMDKTFSLAAHYEALYKDGSAAWKNTLGYVADMQATAARDGVPLIIAMVPDIHDLSPNGPYGTLYKKIEDQFRAMNIPALNMYDVFQKKFGDDASKLWVQRDDPHPNKLGHALIADELYRYVVEQHLLKP